MSQGFRIPAFRRFRSDRRGAILPMAAVTALILLMLAGLAIDVSMIISAKNRVRRTMDAAGIAIATHFRDQEPTQSDVEAFTVKWMNSNFPSRKIGEYFNLVVNWEDGVADISAKVRVDTIFMDLVGANEIDANVGIRVISETRGLEIALALDNTGSMNGTEINWLRASVNDFVNILFDNATDPSSIRIGMVPFVAAVNIRDPNTFPSWLDAINPEDVVILDDNVDTAEPLVSYHGEIFDPRTSHAYLYKQFATLNGDLYWYDAWKGCVEARSATYNGLELDVNDVPPDPAYPETLFVPYFWPDEPDENTTDSGGDKDNDPLLITSDSSLATSLSTGEYRVRNNFLDDLLEDTSLTFEERISSIIKYTDLTKSVKFDETGPITSGPSKSCPNPIVPLTSDRAYLNDLLENQDYLDDWNEGGSNLAQGIMWAWRVLSSNPPFTEGGDYLDGEGNVNKKIEKILIVFFAGPNGIVYQPNPFYSDYSAYGYVVPDGRLDPAGENDLNTKTKKVCENARAPAGDTSREKIILYAIGYEVADDDPIADLMEQCTGDPDRVFLAADTEALRAVFNSLAEDLTKLRVVY